jgi:hypothetical protein
VVGQQTGAVRDPLNRLPDTLRHHAVRSAGRT